MNDHLNQDERLNPKTWPNNDPGLNADGIDGTALLPKIIDVNFKPAIIICCLCAFITLGLYCPLASRPSWRDWAWLAALLYSRAAL